MILFVCHYVTFVILCQLVITCQKAILWTFFKLELFIPFRNFYWTTQNEIMVMKLEGPTDVKTLLAYKPGGDQLTVGKPR